ncbi:MAG TPA: NAD kinase [Burkholderiales bacterium]|nr:NAD kinase [Burkholderiales bacterium]
MPMEILFKTVALIGKYKSPEIADPLIRLGKFLQERGISVIQDRLTADNVKGSEFPALALDEIGRKADLAIVLGGDGTMLNIARTLAPYGVSLVGVNQGRLGFLTDISIDSMLETIGSMLDGQYITENRMLLEAWVVRNEESLFKGLAFNDVVVHRGISGSMIEFEVRINGLFVYTQRSDGLIVATPTGSTAYALSSGGPILYPGLPIIGLVPVNPHTLSNRPIVIGGESTIEIIMKKTGDSRVHFDSHSHFDLLEGDSVFVRRYEKAIRLLHPQGHNYFHMLREKLHWSESF